MSTDQDDSSTFSKEQTTTVEKTTTTDPDQGSRTPQPNIDEVFKDQLSTITNESGEQKYGDVTTALAALKHTQTHIQTLEQENSQFREESVKAKTMDEVLSQLNTTNNSTQAESTNSSEALDVEKLRDVTLETIKNYEAGKSAVANQQEVVSRLTDIYQDRGKAEEAFVAKAQDLGITVAMLDDLAAKSPKAVLEYFQTGSKTTTSKFVEGTVNPDALQSTTQPNPAKKNIMYGASTADIVEAWRAAGQTTEQ